MTENKVTFGLTNVHYSIVTYLDDIASYGVPSKLPGAVEMVLDPKGESSDFFADNRLYHTTASNQGYEGSLVLAEIPEKFRTEVLKEVVDETSKTIAESSNAKPATIALLFSFDGDQQETRHILYHCTVSRSAVGSTTKTEETEVQTRELNLVASPRPSDGIVKRSTTADTPALTYDAWFETVFEA